MQALADGRLVPLEEVRSALDYATPHYPAPENAPAQPVRRSGAAWRGMARCAEPEHQVQDGILQPRPADSRTMHRPIIGDVEIGWV